jgi:NAD-dependent dihydropyrimidine dehydrogenase PreA subunit
VTYIIAEPCIDLKDRSCVDVCPVDCIHEASRILVIDPEECIDCGACEPECPVEAIFPEDALPEKWRPFVRINYAYGDGLTRVDELVEELGGDDDGTAGAREPCVPSPDAPGGGDALAPPRE